MKLLYYKFQQLTLLQIAMDSYYKLLQLFPYKGLLWQDFTKCDVSITDCVAYKRDKLQSAISYEKLPQ